MAVQPQRESTENRLDVLSGREREVLTLLAQGLPNKEVAARLSVSELTVRTHTKRIHRKLGVSNRVQAILAFQECS